jgi:hypothetical protein
METLSIEAKEIIDDLFEKGYTPREIKNAMEDGAYLKEAGISQELSEEIHSFLSGTHIYEAMVLMYDEEDNETKTIKVAGCDEKDIMATVDMIISEANNLDLFYGKIKNFCALK